MSAPTRYKVAAGTAVAAGLLRIAYPYLSRDYHAFRQTSSFLKAARVYLDSKRYIVDMFEEAAAHNPYKTFIIYENTIYTYGDINRMANKFANFVRKKGLKLGDCAAVLMYNEPSFIWSYLGFAKLGIRVAFLNYNLRLDPLVHCIDVSGAKVVIVGHDPELIPAVEGIFSQLQDRGVDVWITGGSYDGPYTHIDNHLSSMSEQPIPRDTRRSLTESDISVYIFTSGTTGHPKASKITYYRQLMAAFMLSPVGITANDRTYISLPLYHSSASMLSFSTVLRTQSTIVLARKLSVRRFWEDCRRHGVTVIFYIGETCRYLLSLPPHPEDKKHSVRVAIGNGLRPDIWERFQKRFNIPVICEFYGATEAPFFSANTDNTVGAIGKFTPIWKLITGLTLIKYDYETAEPIRDAKGRCIPVSRGKVGLLLCPINDRARYDGYSGDKKLSEQKVVRNVFKEGDAYFNSGDLLMLDKNYYLHFVDRLGDTFRWKGENVATTEVSEIVTVFPDIKEANVYGVKVPGQDGRAGMAAIILEDDQVFRLKEFYDYITSSLPLYACPRFLRVMKTLETTGTYKYKKGDLVREGFDPNKVKEPMYFIDLNANTYSPLDEISFGKIVAGKSRL